MQAHEEPAHARAHQAAALLSGIQPENGRHTHRVLSIEMLQDNSDSNLKALDDSPHHISEAVSQELSRCTALPVATTSPCHPLQACQQLTVKPESFLQVLCGFSTLEGDP